MEKLKDKLVIVGLCIAFLVFCIFNLPKILIGWNIFTIQMIPLPSGTFIAEGDGFTSVIDVLDDDVFSYCVMSEDELNEVDYYGYFIRYNYGVTSYYDGIGKLHFEPRRFWPAWYDGTKEQRGILVANPTSVNMVFAEYNPDFAKSKEQDISITPDSIEFNGMIHKKVQSWDEAEFYYNFWATSELYGTVYTVD